MQLLDVDKMPYWERTQLLQFVRCIDNSPHLNNTQKCVVERLLQQIVEVVVNKDFV